MIPQDTAQRLRERGAVLDMPLVQSIYAPLLAAQDRSGVTVTRDLAYGADARQKLDVYRPETPIVQRLPIVVFFHGGGFIRGDKRERENAGLRFAREQLLAVVPGYRLAPAHPWPAGAQDVAAVLDWVRNHASGMGGDPNRIFLAGESAGAAHVATATLLKRFHPAAGLGIAGAMLVSGVYNAQLELLARRQFGVATPDPRNEPHFGSDFALYPSRSTVELVDAAPFPLLITYAELDLPQMQVQAGELFARLVVRHGFAPELKVIAGHNHLSQVYAINTGDDSLVTPLLEFMRAAR